MKKLRWLSAYTTPFKHLVYVLCIFLFETEMMKIVSLTEEIISWKKNRNDLIKSLTIFWKIGYLENKTMGTAKNTNSHMFTDYRWNWINIYIKFLGIQPENWLPTCRITSWRLFQPSPSFPTSKNRQIEPRRTSWCQGHRDSPTFTLHIERKKNHFWRRNNQ